MMSSEAPIADASAAPFRRRVGQRTKRGEELPNRLVNGKGAALLVTQRMCRPDTNQIDGANRRR